MDHVGDDDEDITENPLYRAIKHSYPAAISQLSRRGGILCVPHSTLLRRVRLTQSLLDAHVFLPSPFFIGQFVSLSNRTAREDNGCFTVSDEFGMKRALILSQEEEFSGEKSFRVLCVDSILTDDVERDEQSRPTGGSAGGGSQGTSAVSQAEADDSNQMPKMPARPTFELCLKFIADSSPLNAIVAAKTREQLRVFNQSYCFVRGFEMHAVHKVKGLVNKAVDDFVCANPDFRRMAKSPRAYLQLRLIISSFVLGTIHDKVWQGLSGCFATEDVTLRMESLSLANLSPVKDVGLRPDLLHTIPEAMEIMNRIGDCRTPLEMLYKLQDVIDCFSSKADPSVAASTSSSTVSVVAGDDVLPAFVCSVVRAAPDRLHTLVFYMENFVFADMSSTSLGYALATFRAAIEFIRRTYDSLPLEQRLGNSAGSSSSPPLSSGRSSTDDDAVARQTKSMHIRQVSAPSMSMSMSLKLTQSAPPQQQPSLHSASSASLVAVPPMMQAPPVTVSTAPLPGATVRTFAHQPVITKAPSSPSNDRRLGAFLSRLKKTSGTVSSESFKNSTTATAVPSAH